MSITFSSSEKTWCFFFIIIATRRKRRTQRDSRRANETKRKEFLRPQDRRAQNSRRYHPRPFRRRLRNDLRDHFVHFTPSSLDVEKPKKNPRARACLLFLLLLFAIQKRKERPTSFCHPRNAFGQSYRVSSFLSSAIVTDDDLSNTTSD